MVLVLHTRDNTVKVRLVQNKEFCAVGCHLPCFIGDGIFDFSIFQALNNILVFGFGTLYVPIVETKDATASTE